LLRGITIMHYGLKMLIAELPIPGGLYRHNPLVWALSGIEISASWLSILPFERQLPFYMDANRNPSHSRTEVRAITPSIPLWVLNSISNLNFCCMHFVCVCVYLQNKYLKTLEECSSTSQILSLLFRNHQFESHKSQGYWRLTWSLTSGTMWLVEVCTNWPGHSR